MPNGYVGKTNNHVGGRPRASKLKDVIPPRKKSLGQLEDEMIAAFGKSHDERERTRMLVLERMGLPVSR